MTRSTILYRSAGILLATWGLTQPVVAADLSLASPPPAPVDSSTPVPLRSFAQVWADNTPSPYQLKLQYTGEVWGNQGGLQSGEDYMENYSATLRVDTAKAFGWTGGYFVASGFYNNGPSLGANFVGAVQDPSAMDVFAPNMARLYQMYYDQSFGKSTDVRVGVMDLETEFGTTKPMAIFFNGAFSWNSALDASGAGGLNGPSTYPDTSLGIRVRQIINDELYVKVAVVNGMADSITNPQSNAVTISSANGAFGIGEVDYTPIKNTKIIAGYWMYTGLIQTQDQFTPAGLLQSARGSDGGYVGAATRLYTIQGERAVDGFVNFGMSDPKWNDVDRSVNAGLTVTGLFASRPDDRFGVATGYAHAGAPLQAIQLAQGAPITSYEQTFEMTYRAQLSDWLTVQPNIQYTIHPGYYGTLKNDFLFGLHFEIGHLFNL
ncbi:carbohydrate porin [Bradyrhizobium sp.]|uniref:carbohydrate porin n=1 Tax=Bradyrhizobium sp. TaxID=376 RepID=UPI003C5D8D7A